MLATTEETTSASSSFYLRQAREQIRLAEEADLPSRFDIHFTAAERWMCMAELALRVEKSRREPLKPRSPIPEFRASGDAQMEEKMPRQDVEYYADRARQERTMADAAKDLCARRTHQMLAEHYQRIADGALREVGSREPS